MKDERLEIPAASRPDEASLRLLLENVEKQHFIYTHDLDGVFIYISPSIERILGYTAAEFCTHFTTYLTEHPVNKRAVEHTQGSLSGIVQPPYCVEIYARDRSVHWLEVVEVPVCDAQGGVVAVQGLARDVTLRHNAEEGLRDSEQRFRELAAALPEAVFEFDLQGRFTYVNDAGLRNFGYTEEDVAQGTFVVDMLVPEDRARALQGLSAGFRGDPGNEEYTALRRDGSRFPVHIQARPIVRNDRVVGMRGLVLDLSERRRLEEELLKTQKLESVGLLAGGIAHDFNNLLAAVLGSIELAGLDLPSDHVAQESLAMAEKAALKGRALTQQLLTFARGGAPMKRAVDLEHIITDASQLALAGSNARVELTLAEALRPVEGDDGQLSQIFSNLFINAAQAMPQGGVISVRARNVCRPPGVDATQSADWVQIELADTGVGIPAENLNRIFDPYFTTKPRGSGLGLAVAYSVVRGHGGQISVRSVLDEGTCFTLLLPAQAQVRALAPAGEHGMPRGSGRVLVLDDDPQVRRVVEAMLRALGYQPTGVSDGAEAAAAHRRAWEEGQRFRAALLDLTVPGGLGGAAVSGALRLQDPAVRLVATSGYSNDPVMAHPDAYGFDEVLAKPYQLEHLARLLHALLGGHAEIPPDTNQEGS
ncbi:MAG: PAS domain S-box protein [Pseudomonadota bacterium]